MAFAVGIMEHLYEYDTVASTIKIKHITSDILNQKILHRLRKNDPSFTRMIVRNLGVRDDEYYDYDDIMYTYHPSGAYDVGWLGYFVGKNKYLMKLEFCNVDDEAGNSILSRQYVASL